MREASAQEAIQSVIQYQMNNVWTAIPCVVVAIRDNLSTQLVDVQPTVNQKLKDGTVNERPAILGVPLVFPASNTSALSFPVNVGDTVLCVFSMRSIENFKSGQGLPTTPLNASKFDKKDAIAIPGLFPIGRAINNPAKHVLPHNTKDAVLAHNIGTSSECEIRLKADGSIRITTSNQPIVITGSDVTVNAETIALNANSMSVNVTNTTWTGNITQSGNYTGSGVQTFNGVVFSTHVHGTSPSPSNP